VQTPVQTSYVRPYRQPWLIDDDGGIWIHEGGMPVRGYRPDTHAVFLNGDGSWTYLTRAEASGRKNAPKDRAELERRVREKEEQAKR
jgi:hypothetical protein